MQTYDPHSPLLPLKALFTSSLVSQPSKYKDTHWNRCEVCGRLIALKDFESGKAVRRLITPDTQFTAETYETLCSKHSGRLPTSSDPNDLLL